MFRCITEVRGLVFDIDRFDDSELEMISSIFNSYRILFMTSTDEMEVKLRERFSIEQIYRIDKFQWLFAPNKTTHSEALERLCVKASETVYVSKRAFFIKHANAFLGGTVMIARSISYECASAAPDMICPNLSILAMSLSKNGLQGFLGEVTLFPLKSVKFFTFGIVNFPTDQGEIPLFMLGRYFGSSQYMRQFHPYSRAILLNKREGSKAFGIFTSSFQKLFITAAESVSRYYGITSICAVPSRPGKPDRFAEILSGISSETGLSNIGLRLTCMRDYPSQKSLSAQERSENIRGAFSFRGTIDGEAVIIIDDVVSTGSTLNECINTLKAAGAGAVYAIVLAVNQLGIEYWSSNPVQVSCPACGRPMNLLANSRTKEFFYSCSVCRGTSMDFGSARRRLIEDVNRELE